jgi:hypothetical protein
MTKMYGKGMRINRYGVKKRNVTLGGAIQSIDPAEYREQMGPAGAPKAGAASGSESGNLEKLKSALSNMSISNRAKRPAIHKVKYINI